jgi:glyoxylase-like metal-dependent hydrolase (beta-lactamase superfamily II)
MDAIHLPSYEVMTMDDVAPGVKGVRLLFVNVFAVADDSGTGWTLIDTGIPLSAAKIKHWAENHFGKGTRPNAIILTHGHFDHVGAVKHLVDEWKVPVYAHHAELPYLTGQQKYPPPDPGVGGGLMSVMSPLFPRASADLNGHVQSLPTDGSVPSMSGWRYLHTPGHTIGHISLFRDRDRTLIAGDAISTTRPESFLAVAKQVPELHGPPAYYTPDWDAARTSVRALADLAPRTIAAGHGMPMCGDEIPGQLGRLAREFDHYALPQTGKYARAAHAE